MVVSSKREEDHSTVFMETTLPSYLLAEPSRDLLVVTRQEDTRTWWNRDDARSTICISDAVLEGEIVGPRKNAWSSLTSSRYYQPCPKCNNWLICISKNESFHHTRRRVQPVLPLQAFTGFRFSAHGTLNTLRTRLPCAGYGH